MADKNASLDKKDGIVEAVSTKNLGVKLEGQGWYNNGANDSEAIREQLGDIEWGSKVRLHLDDAGNFREIEVLEEPENPPAPAGGHPAAGKQDRWDDYVNYEELLQQLKDETDGRFKIRTELLHFDMEKGWAIAKATVEANYTPKRSELTEEEMTDFAPNIREASDIGDCTQTNAGKVTKDAFVRMASTRAKVRAIRNVLGIGMTAADELPSEAGQ